MKTTNIFSERTSIKQVEESDELAPKFNSKGLIPVVTTDAESGELLMHGFMNQKALEISIETGEMHYYSRSRQKIWLKGEISGFKQTIHELLIDDDQDAVWAKVTATGGASCHVGYRSCFYRRINLDRNINSDQKAKLQFTETKKVFEPTEVYPEESNPTKL